MSTTTELQNTLPPSMPLQANAPPATEPSQIGTPAVQRTDDDEEGKSSVGEKVLTGVRVVIIAIIRVPFGAAHTMSRVYWQIPVIMQDDTVRAWPEITGIKSGCIAGGQSLFYGFYDGATDWFTLPKKGLKKQGFWGLLKGIIQGLLNLGLKPAAGAFGFIGHPIWGAGKELEKLVDKLTKKKAKKDKKKKQMEEKTPAVSNTV